MANTRRVNPSGASFMKCTICEGEATTRFSPDLDIEGLGACEQHVDALRWALYILLNEGEAAFETYLLAVRKNEPKKDRKKSVDSSIKTSETTD